MTTDRPTRLRERPAPASRDPRVIHRRLRARGRSPERGTAAVEFVLVTPVFLGLLLLIVGLGRIAESRGLVVGAARDAARAASQQRTPEAARDAADRAARNDLTAAGRPCQQMNVTTDIASFATGGLVRVRVACTAGLADLAGIGLPGSKTLRATSTAPLERYRGVAP